MYEEPLWNNIRMLQPDQGFRLGTDSVLLADFATLPKGAQAVDLGTGSGAVGLLLCAKSSQCSVTGLEIQEEACALARKNVALNALEERFRVVCGDLRQIRTLLPAARYDVVTANPPYFPVGSGGICDQPSLAIARTEVCCTLEDVCAAAGWLLRFGGSFALVHRPERLCDLIWQMRLNHIEPKRIRFVRHRAGAGVCMVLLEGRKGGKPGLRYEPDLIQFDETGRETAEYRAIYHH